MATVYTQALLNNASDPTNVNWVGEMVVTISSLLYDTPITDAQFYLYNPSGATGTVTCALRRQDGTLVHTFWTKDISTLPTTAGTLTSETSSPYTSNTAVGDVIAISTDSTTAIKCQIQLGTRPFDGTNTAWALNNAPPPNNDFNDYPYGAYFGDCGFQITIPSPPPASTGTRLPPPPIVLGGL